MTQTIQNVRLLTTDSAEWRAYVKSCMSAEASYRNPKYSDLGAIHTHWFEEAVRAELKRTNFLREERILSWQECDARGHKKSYFHELDGVLFFNDIVITVEIKFSLSSSSIRNATQQVNLASRILCSRYPRVSTLRIFGDGRAYCPQLGRDEEAVSQLVASELNTLIEIPWNTTLISANTSYVSLLEGNSLDELCKRHPHPLDEFDSYREI